MRRNFESGLKWCAGFLLAAFLLTPSSAEALVLYNSATVAFAGGKLQTGRLFRDHVPSDWSVSKTFPGVSDSSLQFAYQLFDVDPCVTPYIQISVDDPSASFFVSAYLDAYKPVNTGPNFGLDVNYLADAGSSGNSYGNPGFFQLYDPSLDPLVLVANEFRPGGGSGKSLGLLVEGFMDVNYTDPQFTCIPEPSAGVLTLAGGMLGLLVLRRRNKS